MHDSAYRIGELVMRTYCDLPTARILDVGALNVNGCLRDAAAATTHYVGLDLEAGPSVDFVITPGADFPVEDDSFDLVMASSVFEHDSRFWETFTRMCRAARKGGHIYVNAPSNGTVHRYPMDCWRFYPDAGLALAEHARAEGLEIDLVESFIGNRHSDVWNDFVAVFRKGPSAEPLNTAFVYHRYPSLNARTWQSRAVYNESDKTEDMVLINALRERCETLSKEGDGCADSANAELGQARAALASEQAQRTALAEEMARVSALLAETEEHGSRTNAENEQLRGRLTTVESNLRQRQEEIEQAWAHAEQMTADRERLQTRIDELETVRERLARQLTEADGWVFGLAGERRVLEGRLAAVQSDLARVRRSATELETRAEAGQQQLQEHRAASRRIVEGIARIRALDAVPDMLLAQADSLYREWREDAHPLAEVARVIKLLVQPVEAVNPPDLAETGALPVEDMRLLLDRKAGLHADIERLVARMEDRDRAADAAEQKAERLSKVAEHLRAEALRHEGAAAQLLKQKSALHQDVERLLERLEEGAAEARARQEQMSALTQTVATLRGEALDYHAKAAQAFEQLEIQRAENRQQAAALRNLEKRAAQKDRELSWLRRLFQLIEPGVAGWRAMLPARMRWRRASQILQKNGHFDGDAYLAKYTDVAEAGMDPLLHYVLHGMAEGRFVERQA